MAKASGDEARGMAALAAGGSDAGDAAAAISASDSALMMARIMAAKEREDRVRLEREAADAALKAIPVKEADVKAAAAALGVSNATAERLLRQHEGDPAVLIAALLR